ncbi:unnamed protein product [Trichobilharzia regenti]|nr:unnamed protein product [Trichobilharzia regenti]
MERCPAVGVVTTEDKGQATDRFIMKINRSSGSRGPSGLVDNALAFETIGTGFEPWWEHHHSLENADIRLVHDIACVGSVQRQGLTPFPSQSWMSSNSETSSPQNDNEQLNTSSQMANEHQDVWAQAHRCFIDAALLQMNELPSWWPVKVKESWRTTLSKLRFTIASERLSNSIQTQSVGVKVRRNK